MFQHLDWSPPVVNTPDWIWQDTQLSIKGLTADKKKKPSHSKRSREVHIELRNRIVSRHGSWEGYKKKILLN